MRVFRISIAVAVISVLFASCSMMPVAGPESWDVRAGQKKFTKSIISSCKDYSQSYGYFSKERSKTCYGL